MSNDERPQTFEEWWDRYHQPLAPLSNPDVTKLGVARMTWSARDAEVARLTAERDQARQELASVNALMGAHVPQATTITTTGKAPENGERELKRRAQKEPKELMERICEVERDQARQEQDTIVWMIEQREGKTTYLTFGLGMWDWTTDPLKGIHFCRREDANGVAELFDDLDVHICQHEFVGKARQ